MEDLEGLHYQSADSNLGRGWNFPPKQSSYPVDKGQEQGVGVTFPDWPFLTAPPDDLYTSLRNGHHRGERYIFWSFQPKRVLEMNTLVTLKPGVTGRQSKSLGLEFINHYLAEIQESQTGNLWTKCSLKIYIT